jgi:hypothetical protein
MLATGYKSSKRKNFGGDPQSSIFFPFLMGIFDWPITKKKTMF